MQRRDYLPIRRRGRCVAARSEAAGNPQALPGGLSLGQPGCVYRSDWSFPQGLRDQVGLTARTSPSSTKRLATLPGVAPEYTGSSSTASPAIQDLTGSVAFRDPMMPAPETRPTTIEGWTVLDVRDGTAVLEGPDGVRMATRGDTVPGIGRVDSIVRWGNRWIVATASGLIATP
jgi:hypothetical protein